MFYHFYADDTQLYITFRTSSVSDMNLRNAKLVNCVRDIYVMRLYPAPLAHAILELYLISPFVWYLMSMQSVNRPFSIFVTLVSYANILLMMLQRSLFVPSQFLNLIIVILYCTAYHPILIGSFNMFKILLLECQPVSKILTYYSSPEGSSLAPCLLSY